MLKNLNPQPSLDYLNFRALNSHHWHTGWVTQPGHYAKTQYWKLAIRKHHHEAKWSNWNYIRLSPDQTANNFQKRLGARVTMLATETAWSARPRSSWIRTWPVLLPVRRRPLIFFIWSNFYEAQSTQQTIKDPQIKIQLLTLGQQPMI